MVFCVFYFHPQWREIFLNIFKYPNIIERLASLVTVKSFTCNTLETEVKSNHLERGGMTKSSEAMPFNHSGTCKAFHECYPTLFINLSLCAVNLQVLVSFAYNHQCVNVIELISWHSKSESKQSCTLFYLSLRCCNLSRSFWRWSLCHEWKTTRVFFCSSIF